MRAVRLKLEGDLNPVFTSVNIGLLKWTSLGTEVTPKASGSYRCRCALIRSPTFNNMTFGFKLKMYNASAYWPTINGLQQIYTSGCFIFNGGIREGLWARCNLNQNIISLDIAGRQNIIALTYMPVKAPGRGGQQR